MGLMWSALAVGTPLFLWSDYPDCTPEQNCESVVRERTGLGCRRRTRYHFGVETDRCIPLVEVQQVVDASVLCATPLVRPNELLDKGALVVHVRVKVPAITIGALLLAGCACDARDYKCFVRERPPCAFPPLTDEQVMAVARRELGESFFSVAGMPERPYRISPQGCVYEVEYVALSLGNEWFSLDGIDSTSWMFVARDLSVFRPEIVIPNQ